MGFNRIEFLSSTVVLLLLFICIPISSCAICTVSSSIASGFYWLLKFVVAVYCMNIIAPCRLYTSWVSVFLCRLVYIIPHLIVVFHWNAFAFTIRNIKIVSVLLFPSHFFTGTWIAFGVIYNGCVLVCVWVCVYYFPLVVFIAKLLVNWSVNANWSFCHTVVLT